MTRASLSDELADRILALPGVVERPSRFGGGRAFRVGDREFAHFHPGDEIDLRVTRGYLRTVKQRIEGDPRIHRRRPGSDWIEFRYASGSDLDDAMEWVRLARSANAG